jgi:hypothetical protein
VRLQEPSKRSLLLSRQSRSADWACTTPGWTATRSGAQVAICAPLAAAPELPSFRVGAVLGRCPDRKTASAGMLIAARDRFGSWETCVVSQTPAVDDAFVS